MKIIHKHLPLLGICTAFNGFDSPLFADATAPVLSVNAAGSTKISIQFPNLVAGAP